MRLLGTLIGTLFVLVAVSIAATAPAQASVKPQFLPEATALLPIEFTDKHGITHFEEKKQLPDKLRKWHQYW